MKRWVCLILVMMLLAGCADSDAYMERGLALRSRILSGSYSFDARITANYTDQIYCFTLSCSASSDGSVSFTVQEPASIQGITGSFTAAGGQLTFDDIALSFPLLADGEVSAVSSVWILINTLRGGYMRACGMDEDSLRLTIDDSYEADALQLDIWLDGQDLPKYAEILWQGRRILSLEVSNFVFV